MGFFKTLTALFVRDTINDANKAKKETEAERTKKQREDNERYHKYADLCFDAEEEVENTLNRIFDREFDFIDFSNERKREMQEIILAYPLYAVLCEQGGGVDELQKRFLNTICFRNINGDYIIEAAQKKNLEKMMEIEEAALKYEKFGGLWVELLSIPTVDEELLKNDVKIMVEKTAEVAKQFAILADVIVEQELVREMVGAFEREVDRPRKYLIPNRTPIQAALSVRRHAKKLNRLFEDYCNVVNIEIDLMKMMAEATLYGIAYQNLQKFSDKITDSKSIPMMHLATACDFEKIKPDIDWVEVIETEKGDGFVQYFRNPYPSTKLSNDNPPLFFNLVYISHDSVELKISTDICLECQHILTNWAEETEKLYSFKGLISSIMDDFKTNVSDVLINRLENT